MDALILSTDGQWYQNVRKISQIHWSGVKLKNLWVQATPALNLLPIWFLSKVCQVTNVWLWLLDRVAADVCLQVWYLRIRQQTHSKRKWVQMQSRPSYLSKFLDGEMFHNWVKYMLQLFMWSPRLDKVVGAIVSMVKVQNKRVALLK